MSEYGRPDKLSHAQTILYEIDMLKFAAGNLEGPTPHARWRNLECFLLHFRNLIEFFGKDSRKDNLSIWRPKVIWPDQTTRPTDDVLRSLRRTDLWQKYEMRDHHCTEQRTEWKSWKVREMFDELEPVILAFEDLLPDKCRPWCDIPNPDRRMQMPENVGTGTVTPGQSIGNPIFEYKKKS